MKKRYKKQGKQSRVLGTNKLKNSRRKAQISKLHPEILKLEQF